MEGEILFLLLLALIVLGPRRLPEIGRQIGKALAELRRAKYEFTRQIQDEIQNIEQQEAAAKQQKTLPATETAISADPTQAANTILPPRTSPAGTVNVRQESSASDLENASPVIPAEPHA